jgi:hypothetical protein
MHAAVPVPWRGREEVQRRVAERESDYDAMRAELVEALRARPEQRPARRPQPTLDGYLRGAYVFHDYAGGDHLRAVSEVMEKRPLARFARRAGEPLLLAAESSLAPLGEALADGLTAEVAHAEPLLWSADEVRYRVTAGVPVLLVENEVAYPGWTAVRADDGSALAPVAAAWPLRAWHAPAGEYDVVLEFRMPARRGATWAALAAIGTWLAVLLAAVRVPGRGAHTAARQARAPVRA